MDQTLHQLGQLLLGSIPTILIFVVLHLLLRRVLYAPLQRTLQERTNRIEGRMQAARQQFQLAEEKLAQYEAQLREARLANYRRIDERRQAALTECQQILDEARRQSTDAVVAAREQIASDAARVRAQLQGEVETLAGEVTASVLGRKTTAVPPGANA
jgi:F-type H+-transporting ATPase subunit b